jgi:hypothetical protein
VSTQPAASNANTGRRNAAVAARGTPGAEIDSATMKETAVAAQTKYETTAERDKRQSALAVNNAVTP